MLVVVMMRIITMLGVIALVTASTLTLTSTVANMTAFRSLNVVGIHACGMVM